MKKYLVFDMDGTIADLYGVKNWLTALENHDPAPYRYAKPLYDMDTLREVLNLFRLMGWGIIVTTWLAKDSNKNYDRLVREAKLEWLERYAFPYDEIHLVKYGTTKADCTRNKGGFQILIDDNDAIRKGWTLGDTINANENILEKLTDLLESILIGA